MDLLRLASDHPYAILGAVLAVAGVTLWFIPSTHHVAWYVLREAGIALEHDKARE